MYLQHKTITGFLLSQPEANDVMRTYHPGAENEASAHPRTNVTGKDVDVHSLGGVNPGGAAGQESVSFLGVYAKTERGLAEPCSPSPKGTAAS